MGLVVQAPADTLAAMLAPVVNAQADGGTAGPGGFAAALQALLTDAGGAKGGKAAALLALLPKPTGEGDGDGSPSGADALAAALAALQALIAPPQPATATATPPPGAEASVAAAAPQAAAANGLPADAIAPTEADTGAEAATGKATPGTTPPAEAGTLNAADALAEAQALLAGPAGGAKPSGAPPAEHKAEALSGAPPPGAEATPQDAASVVRFAGNAQDTGTSADADPGGKPGDGAKPRATASIDAASPVAIDVRGGQAPTAATAAAPAPATGATPPQAAPDLPPAVPQVAQSVLDQAQKGGGEARIHLHPAELGDIVVHVRTDGDHVRVEIHADRADAMNLLRDHTGDLSNLLGSRGLNLGDVYVGLGANGGGNANQGGDQHGPGNRPAPNGAFASLMGINDAPPVEIHNRLRTAYNPDGAHSYRI